MTRNDTSSHTPGPWTCHLVTDGRDRPDTMIQPTYAINISGNAWPIVSRAEATANARLIAGVPDMLVVLHAAYHALQSYRYGNGSPDLATSVAAAIDAVLAEVEGKS